MPQWYSVVALSALIATRHLYVTVLNQSENSIQECQPAPKIGGRSFCGLEDQFLNPPIQQFGGVQNIL